MKKGLMFFLNLHSYIKVARICLIPAAFFLFFARGVVLMAVSASIAGILLVISLIRAPSDEEILKGIKQFHEEFSKRVQADTETKRYNESKTLKGYRQGSGTILKRQVDGEYVYSCILDVGMARRGTDFTFYVGEWNLLHESEGRHNQYAVGPGNFRYTYEPLPGENAAKLEFMLTDANIHLVILVDNDYHARDFLEIVTVFDS